MNGDLYGRPMFRQLRLQYLLAPCTAVFLVACFVGDDDAGSETDATTMAVTTTPTGGTAQTDATETGDSDTEGSDTEGESTTEEPTTDGPTTDGPTTTEDPTTEDPTTEDPTTEDPTTEDPTTEDPTTTTGDPDVPDNPYCAEAANWNSQYASLEAQIVTIVNQRRSEGANCGGQQFGPTQPLTMEPALRCAARKHSKDMAENNFFDHTNLMGESPWDRIDMAGYGGFGSGENIAAGNATAEATMQQWMESSGHCSNIMNPDFNEIGVGYYPGGQWGHMWTQTFGVN